MKIGRKTLEIDESNIIEKCISIDDFPHLRSFKCGNGSMENFLSLEAYHYHIEREASTTLVFYNNELIAYYTIKRAIIPTLIQSESLKDSQYFSLDIARLAVSENYQSKGVGSYILNNVIRTAIKFNERFITLDAIKEKWTWYRDLFTFDYLYEDDILPENGNIVVTMYLDLFDEKLVEVYYDE